MTQSFRSSMESQGIPFYRLNPKLDEDIATGESDLLKLVNMLIKVRGMVIAQCLF